MRVQWDGVAYTPLHQDLCTYVNVHEWQSFAFSNTSSDRYYRLYGLNNWGCSDDRNQMIIEEWEMFESSSGGVGALILGTMPRLLL